jgi:hypothetical protein
VEHRGSRCTGWVEARLGRWSTLVVWAGGPLGRLIGWRRFVLTDMRFRWDMQGEGAKRGTVSFDGREAEGWIHTKGEEAAHVLASRMSYICPEACVDDLFQHIYIYTRRETLPV